MAIFALFTDSLICTITILVLLLTGVWQKEGLQLSEYVMVALKPYVPHVKYFMALLFLAAGFTTIVGYFVVGQKCASYLNKSYGKQIYIAYSTLAFIFFSFYEQDKVMLVMSVSGGFLMLINILGIIKLRKEIQFL